jgi:RNA polymerase sigma-70 factor (ECF subfamily)
LDLIAGIARLPAHERIVVTLRHLEGLGMAEIATVTDRPVKTVYKQLSRAYARLRTWLGDEVEHA